MAKKKLRKKKTSRKKSASKKSTKKAGRRRTSPDVLDESFRIQEIPFHTAARRRYLNYALSVITSRALPDVRDGLKPVQRRILYTMQNDLHLPPSAKPLKCARIVGDVLGKYHPHGDSAVYEALVRMAQDFSLRYPLVDGHGNFGSLDGDSAAAYRYTEARLQAVALELLDDLGKDTVDFRPTYDGKTHEPAVLPAKVPQLLINGTTGIAVGMATNIPPHNLSEVLEACEALIARRRLSLKELLKYVKGPDFPTGGEILNSRAEIHEIYEQGQGAIRMRGEFTTEKGVRGQKRIVITSIPYMLQKNVLVKAIGDLVFERKVPQLLDVRDESTADVRIVLELKDDADTDRVMAYLFKNTQLQSNFNVNLTCLVPTDGAGVCGPQKLDLKSILMHFIEFRYEVVERRFQHELRLLRERIHILEGFRKIFDALDEAIRIIRRSDGRAQAAQALIKRFQLDEQQANAVLDLRLYKLAKLEIKAILDELRQKKKRVAEIRAILNSPQRIWTVVKKELRQIRVEYGDKRRTRVGVKAAPEVTFDEEDFIVDEDSYILLSRDGWVKRAGRVADLTKVRVRPDDELLAVVGGNSRSTVTFFSNLGSAYTARINDLPMSRGYGEPIQRFFKFRDGERVVAAVSYDERFLSGTGDADDPDTVPDTVGLAVSSSGYALRCPLHGFAEPSTRTGRRYARVRPGEEVVGFHLLYGEEKVIIATKMGRVILFSAEEIKFLTGPGRGVIAIKIAKKDRVIGTAVSCEKSKGLRAVTTGGRKVSVTPRSYKVTGRGGKGFEVIKRGGLARVERPELELPELELENGVSQNGNGRGKSPKKKRRR